MDMWSKFQTPPEHIPVGFPLPGKAKKCDLQLFTYLPPSSKHASRLTRCRTPVLPTL